MIKNKILFFSIVYVVLFSITIYSMGESKMKKELIDLTLKFNLAGINKVVIETLPFIKDKPYKKIDLTDKNLLDQIISELKYAEETGGIDTWCQYRIDFYGNDIKIFELEFCDNSDLSFIRYRSKKEDISKDYLINKKLYLLLHSLVSKNWNKGDRTKSRTVSR